MPYVLNRHNSEVTFTVDAPVPKQDRVSLIKQQTSKQILQTCQGLTLWIVGSHLNEILWGKTELKGVAEYYEI